MYLNLKYPKVNNHFKFRKFTIKQENSVFKVGTDGVLLGCLANIDKATRLLDIGTGTGLLSLISAQRNPSISITAIDSEEEAASLAKKNCSESSFSKNIRVIHEDLNNYFSDFLFDYIICNPPFFKASKQLHQKHPVARQQIKFSYDLLFAKAKEIIDKDGKLGLIFPTEGEKEVLSKAEKNNFYPERLVYISGIRNGKIKRIFIEFSLNKKEILTDSIYIEESPREWSSQYKKLTADFYL
ncbi:methyltransferase domain-containing protein [Apibacter muscae]|uniref:Methyltransferase domain-containing protein n=1 Tax=Apibacter muscae TaxID=2509004 RepID=A0A563DG65_9FLAO|nr:methyltransferase domain-containing protein [Apibacter muscae]